MALLHNDISWTPQNLLGTIRETASSFIRASKIDSKEIQNSVGQLPNTESLWIRSVCQQHFKKMVAGQYLVAWNVSSASGSQGPYRGVRLHLTPILKTASSFNITWISSHPFDAPHAKGRRGRLKRAHFQLSYSLLGAFFKLLYKHF